VVVVVVMLQSDLEGRINSGFMYLHASLRTLEVLSRSVRVARDERINDQYALNKVFGQVSPDLVVRRLCGGGVCTGRSLAPSVPRSLRPSIPSPPPAVPLAALSPCLYPLFMLRITVTAVAAAGRGHVPVRQDVL
jgi:hypothetical protein